MSEKYTHNIAWEHFYWIFSTIDPKAIDGAGCNIINTTKACKSVGRVEIRINMLSRKKRTEERILTIGSFDCWSSRCLPDDHPCCQEYLLRTKASVHLHRDFLWTHCLSRLGPRSWSSALCVQRRHFLRHLHYYFGELRHNVGEKNAQDFCEQWNPKHRHKGESVWAGDS